MQRKLLQSSDYCRAVNTIKGLLWIGSTVWKSVWQEHTVMKCVCVCVSELHRQQPLCISAQGFLSPAVEDMQAAGCSSVPQCSYVHRDQVTLQMNPSPLSTVSDMFKPQEQNVKKLFQKCMICALQTAALIADCRHLQHHVWVWTPLTFCQFNTSSNIIKNVKICMWIRTATMNFANTEVDSNLNVLCSTWDSFCFLVYTLW